MLLKGWLVLNFFKDFVNGNTSFLKKKKLSHEIIMGPGIQNLNKNVRDKTIIFINGPLSQNKGQQII